MNDKDNKPRKSILKILLKWETIVSIILASTSWRLFLIRFNSGLNNNYVPIYLKDPFPGKGIIDFIEIILLSFLYYSVITFLVNTARNRKSKNKPTPLP
jgi:hypothetical protein